MDIGFSIFNDAAKEYRIKHQGDCDWIDETQNGIGESDDVIYSGN